MADDQERLTPPDIKMATGVGEPPETIPIETPTPVAPAPSVPIGPQPEFFAPETLGPTPIPEGVTGKSTVLKTVSIALGIVILVGGVGALSYFVVFPLLFPSQAPKTEQPPVITQPLATHESFLVNAPAAEAEVKLSDLNYQTIASVLQNESFNQLADGQFKEVKISDNRGQVPFPSYLASLVPASTALGGTDWFGNDFTAILYYDSNGVWPIYVAKIKSGVGVSTVLNGLKTLENVMDVQNFYLLPPGTFSIFKDGKVGNYATRYAVGAQAGAAFNYVIANDYLVFSTTFNGLKVLLPLLGL